MSWIEALPGCVVIELEQEADRSWTARAPLLGLEAWSTSRDVAVDMVARRIVEISVALWGSLINPVDRDDQSGVPFLRERWDEVFHREPVRGRAGLPDLGELRRTEWSQEFECLMRNRLIMGAFRYAPINAPGKAKYAHVENIERLVARYRETGNDECLVDIANSALLEYEEGDHPLKHFGALDDGEHIRRHGDEK